MPDKQVLDLLSFRRAQKLRFGHDGKGPDMRAAQLGIVVMMVIMRTAPDAAGAQGVNPEEPHENLSQPRFRKDRVVLLIMVNDKNPQDQQTTQNTEEKSSEQVKIGQSSSQCKREEGCARKDTPPTFSRGVPRETFCRKNQLRAGFWRPRRSRNGARKFIFSKFNHARMSFLEGGIDNDVRTFNPAHFDSRPAKSSTARRKNQNLLSTFKLSFITSQV